MTAMDELGHAVAPHACRNDRWSRTFALLLERESALRVLRIASQRSPHRLLGVLECDVVSERSEKRRVLRYRVRAAGPGESPQFETWYAKQYRGSNGARVAEVIRALEERKLADAAGPELVGYSQEHRLLVTREVEGSTLPALLTHGSAEELESILRQVGLAVAWIHTIEHRSLSQVLHTHGPAQEVEVLRLAYQRVEGGNLPRAVVRRLADAGTSIEAELLRRSSSRNGSAVDSVEGSRIGGGMLHRDLHPKQIVIQTGSTGFLDWDSAAMGERELDIGNLEAHIALLMAHQSAPAGSERPLLGAFRSGYLERGDFDESRLAAYRKAALLRLATLERLAQPEVSTLDWPALATALLERIDVDAKVSTS